LYSSLYHTFGCWLTSSIWEKIYQDLFLASFFVKTAVKSITISWVIHDFALFASLRVDVARPPFFRTLRRCIQRFSRVRPLVDCLCKDSCEVVSAAESHPIVVCFCLQKHHCKNLYLSSFVTRQSAGFVTLFSVVVFKWFSSLHEVYILALL
jgi:hypothetical protein